MNETTFKIRPYSKRELAKLYFPFTENEETAVANLRMWMVRNGEVLVKLREAGYRNHCKIFTPRQVKILLETFGEP